MLTQCNQCSGGAIQKRLGAEIEASSSTSELSFALNLFLPIWWGGTSVKPFKGIASSNGRVAAFFLTSTNSKAACLYLLACAECQNSFEEFPPYEVQRKHKWQRNLSLRLYRDKVTPELSLFRC